VRTDRLWIGGEIEDPSEPSDDGGSAQAWGTGRQPQCAASPGYRNDAMDAVDLDGAP
jgi:hypothetical protein